MINQLDHAGLECLPKYPDLGPELECTNPEIGTAVIDQVDVEPTTFALVEMLLKNPDTVDRWNSEPNRQGELFPRFLLIALTSYLIYASLLVLVLNLAPAAAYPSSPLVPLPAPSWSLPLAYAIGIVLAACVCLPSFYFYSLLAGVHLRWLQITSVIGKGMAANAILLLGLAPIYVVAALGAIIFEGPMDLLQAILGIGLLLPFAAGLWGMHAIFLGLMNLTAALPPAWQCGRKCFLRRLVLSWTAVYAAVVPLMIYRLWELFS